VYFLSIDGIKRTKRRRSELVLRGIELIRLWGNWGREARSSHSRSVCPPLSGELISTSNSIHIDMVFILESDRRLLDECFIKLDDEDWHDLAEEGVVSQQVSSD